MNSTEKKEKKFIQLDCTLRDGGYYNNWDFDIDLVKFYLKAMSRIDIDFVEIGLRSLKNTSFKGPYAYSTDSFIRELDIPENLRSRIGVMINGDELVDNLSGTLEAMFTDKKESPVTLVRVACHYEDLLTCLPAAEWLKSRGYKVGFNLMQISNVNSIQLTEILNEVKKHPIDVFYFADSLGCLMFDDVIKISQIIQQNWSGDIGIHAHDNMGQALNNTMTAKNNGVTWLDSTVTGMGRGPGNTQTEFLYLALLDDYDGDQADSLPLLELIDKFFIAMKNHYGWGTNPFYYLSGKNHIHPTYIQKMLQDSRYKNEDILSVIEYFKEVKGSRYNSDALEDAMTFYKSQAQGSWNPKQKLKDKSVLILGTGPGIRKYKIAIVSYIKKHKPIVIALNSLQEIPENLISYRIACHPLRILSDYNIYKSLTTPLITPISMLPLEIKHIIKDKVVFDYGLSLNENSFEFFENYSCIPMISVIAYCLGVVTAGKAKDIKLAGFDGYEHGDIRNDEMRNLFRDYEKCLDQIPICTITPNKYQLKSKSIYGLI